MLDIIMTAHVANFKLMARRGLDSKGEVILGSLPSAVDLVGTPGKVVLSLEGGDRQDLEAAEAYLQSQALAWQIVHSDEVTDYKTALRRGLEQCSSPLVAVIPAWVEVKDPIWVTRMTWSITKDPTCLICGTYPEQGPAKDLAPAIMPQRVWPGGDFFVARRDKLQENIRLCNGDDMHDSLAKAASENGWRIWVHPGVRFKVHEHKSHERQKVG